ncbi:MAG: hypothetical protein U9Q90_06350 [Campylobacterota bacterium]|nr:hypothetical protein [Campylobacterota bacterium]
MAIKKLKQLKLYRPLILLFSFYLLVLQAAVNMPELHHFLDGAKVVHQLASNSTETTEHTEHDDEHLCAVTLLALGVLPVFAFKPNLREVSPDYVKAEVHTFVYAIPVHKGYNPRDPPRFLS